METNNDKYKIIRFRMGGKSRVLKRGVSLEEARQWCNNPETSSSTCSDSTARKVGRGSWFDGYTKE